MATTIQMRSVSKTYGGAKLAPVHALTPTTLDLAEGEFFSLVGPSGCGKSTLLNMIAGLLGPTSGEISIGGRVVTEARRETSVVFQKATLLRWLTVFDNVCLPSKVAGKLDAEAVERAHHYLEMVGLSAVANRYPEELSGGMQQRASIVRALVSDPDVLLMDEPFSALDEFTRETLQDELLNLWMARPKTVVFITHNIGEAVYLSDRVGVMTARPGALESVIDVPFARPRRAELRTDPHFYEMCADVRRLIGDAHLAAKGA